MREIRLHGSEGGGAETNRSFLPLSGVGRLSRVDPRLLREATSHDHRRGVRTHLSTDRVAPAPSQVRKFLKDLGLKFYRSVRSPCRQTKTWPSTLPTKPLFSRPN